MEALQNFPPNINTHTAADYFQSFNVQNQEYRDVETLLNNIAPSSIATFNTNMANNSNANYVTRMSYNSQ